MSHLASTSRSRAQRALVWQGVAIVLVALACWVLPSGGARAGLAALAAGTVLVLAGWLSLLVALGGGVVGSTGAVSRLLAGLLLKWGVTALGLLAVVGVFRMPPLPVLIAVVATVLAYIAANAIPNGKR